MSVALIALLEAQLYLNRGVLRPPRTYNKNGGKFLKMFAYSRLENMIPLVLRVFQQAEVGDQQRARE